MIALTIPLELPYYILLSIPLRPMKKSARDIDTLIEVDHEDAILNTFMLFVQTAQGVLKYTEARLYRQARLSVSKLVILKALASNGGTMMPSEIARWTNTERHNITALVARMRQDGLVTAERNSSDKRFVNIKLTDKGREVLSQAMPVAREVVNQVMLSITEGDTALLKEKLRILRQNAHYGLGHVAKRSQPQPG
jgi:DNA-binding MarR family transcriptional regulator